MINSRLCRKGVVAAAAASSVGNKSKEMRIRQREQRNQSN